MPRSVNSVASRARRKKILKQTKGNFHARANVYTVAKNTLEKGWTHAYNDRKDKKRNYRVLWIQRINAAVRAYGLNYSQFIGKLAKTGAVLAILCGFGVFGTELILDLTMKDPGPGEVVVYSQGSPVFAYTGIAVGATLAIIGILKKVLGGNRK